MRYELDEQLAPHPWRKRRNAMSKALEPDYTIVRGIRDTETGDWHTQPRSKSAGQFTDVRALNGMPPLTMQKVRSVLKSAAISFSKSHSTRIRGWHSVTSGVTIQQTKTGELRIGYNANHWAEDRDVPKLLAPALKALQEAGLNPQQTEDGLITL